MWHKFYCWFFELCPICGKKNMEDFGPFWGSWEHRCKGVK